MKSNFRYSLKWQGSADEMSVRKYSYISIDRGELRTVGTCGYPWKPCRQELAVIRVC